MSISDMTVPFEQFNGESETGFYGNCPFTYDNYNYNQDSPDTIFKTDENIWRAINHYE